MPGSATAQAYMVPSSAAGSPSEENLSEDALLWAAVQRKLRRQHGEDVFKSWFAGLAFVHLRGQTVTLGAPTRFIREWVISHYQQDLLALWREAKPEVRALDIFVKPRQAVFPAGTENQAAAGLGEEAPASSSGAEEQDMSDGAGEADEIGAPLDPRYRFEHFVVGGPNELAHAAALRIAESPEPAAGCNPLFLYGGVGLGKTHLMHAIAWHVRQHQPVRRVVYLSAEKFMYQFIRSLRYKDTMAFKERFRSVDVLLIDDIQFIAGKDSTQEEFFHTFNSLVDHNRQVVISGDCSPSDMDGMEERVRSRLGWGLVVDVCATTYELRLGILQSKAEAMDVAVPREVLEFLAAKITSNIRELEGALNRVVAHATLVGRPVTLETIPDVLADLLRSCERRLTVEDIQKKVAEHYAIKVADMYSARRSRAVARPRQVAMFLAKRLTPKSLPEIGRKFGGKDHTTVMHAVRRIEALIEEDPEIREDVELLTRLLRQGK